MNGYVSPRSARKEYGVILNPKTMKVDKKATHQLRAALRKGKPEGSKRRITTK